MAEAATRTAKTHPGKKTIAEEYQPPAPWRSFAVRLMGTQGGLKTRREYVADHLSNDELAWIGRVISAELKRRQRLRFSIR